MEHKSIPTGQVGIAHNWEVENDAERNALIINDPAMLRRLLCQRNGNEPVFYVLTGVAPAVWYLLGGAKGEDGKSFTVDATGTLAERDQYDNEPAGFSFLSTTDGMLYIREGTAGNWSDGIPFGKGETGDPGPANTLTIGTVTYGETAAATITGTSPNQTLNLVLPRGEKGDIPSIEIGTTSTGLPGTEADVEIIGDPVAGYTLNFTIPRGNPGTGNGDMLKSENLSGLADNAVARTNIGLGNVDNVSAEDLRDRSTHTGTQAISTITGLADALEEFILSEQIGETVAPLVDGKVPETFLPDVKDAVVQVANFAALPETGDANTLYITVDDNRTFRWDGTEYVGTASDLQSTDDLSEGLNNLYFTAARVRATVLTGFAQVTAGIVLASDTVLQGLQKLQAQITNLYESKEDTIEAGGGGTYWRGDKTWQDLNKAAVGLGNVDNTSDASKAATGPIKTALDEKLNRVGENSIDAYDIDPLVTSPMVSLYGGNVDAYMEPGIKWTHSAPYATYLIASDATVSDKFILLPNATGTAALLQLAQQWTAPQRTEPLTDNDGSFDLAAKQDFFCTPTAPVTLTFTNIAAGAKGVVLLVNSGVAISKASTVKCPAGMLAAISAAGRYRLSYTCTDGTNVDVTSSVALS